MDNPKVPEGFDIYPIELVSNLDEQITQLSKENKALREGIEKAMREATSLACIFEDIENLLSSNTQQDTVDKSTQIVSKEVDLNLYPDSNAYQNHDAENGHRIKKDWSDWYPYLDEVDFTDWIITKCRKENGDIVIGRRPFEGEEYQIKLDGVKVIWYSYSDLSCYFGKTEIIEKGDVIGIDHGNKIIIIKDESTINQKE